MNGVDLLAARAADQNCRPGVFIKIDVGLHRCGREPGDPRVTDLAGALTRATHLEFRGLLSHAGHVYGAADGEAAARIAEEERFSMVALADRLRRAGFRIPEVSVGSTPTVLAVSGTGRVPADLSQPRLPRDESGAAGLPAKRCGHRRPDS